MKVPGVPCVFGHSRGPVMPGQVVTVPPLRLVGRGLAPATAGCDADVSHALDPRGASHLPL